jgi:hypothetical protein
LQISIAWSHTLPVVTARVVRSHARLIVVAAPHRGTETWHTN